MADFKLNVAFQVAAVLAFTRLTAWAEVTTAGDAPTVIFGQPVPSILYAGKTGTGSIGVTGGTHSFLRLDVGSDTGTGQTLPTAVGTLTILDHAVVSSNLIYAGGPGTGRVYVTDSTLVANVASGVGPGSFYDLLDSGFRTTSLFLSQGAWLNLDHSSFSGRLDLTGGSTADLSGAFIGDFANPQLTPVFVSSSDANAGRLTMDAASSGSVGQVKIGVSVDGFSQRATFDVLEGSYLYARSMQIGEMAGEVALPGLGEVLVSGAGSGLNVTGRLDVVANETGRLFVDEGATLAADKLAVGRLADAVSIPSQAVFGGNSTVTVASELEVARGVVEVVTGAKLQSNTAARIGTAAIEGRLTVTDASFKSSGLLTIGDNGIGRVAITRINNALPDLLWTIDNIRIGRGAGSSGTLVFDHAGGVLNSLELGAGGSAALDLTHGTVLLVPNLGLKGNGASVVRATIEHDARLATGS